MKFLTNFGDKIPKYRVKHKIIKKFAKKIGNFIIERAVSSIMKQIQTKKIYKIGRRKKTYHFFRVFEPWFCMIGVLYSANKLDSPGRSYRK